MKWISVFLITLFLLVGIKCQLFSQQDPGEQEWSSRSSKYPGLKFWIHQESARSHFKDLNKYKEHWNGQPTLSTILKNMDTCFNEAVAKYVEHNKELPSCLTNGLNKLLEKLKKPGTPILNCTWYIDPNVPWPFVYRQKHFDLLEAEAGGMSTTAEHIYLITLWQKTYEYKFDEEKSKTVIKASNPRTVLTSSILMHELIHCVKKHYPECFKILDEPEEEGTTEDGEVKIYGEENCGTYYKDYKGWDYKCTYETVCECDCSDEKSKFF